MPIFVHEDGTPLDKHELEYLNSLKMNGQQPQQRVNGHSENYYLKVWLLVILSVVIIASIAFCIVEYQQQQQVLNGLEAFARKMMK